jgi:hypothetical protein
MAMEHLSKTTCSMAMARLTRAACASSTPKQTIRNNHLSGLTGERFSGALVVMNGVPDSPINRYHQVDGAVIENNVFDDVRKI